MTAAGPVGAARGRVDGITIQDNRVTDAANNGITVSGGGARPRPAAGEPWPTASTDVLVTRNVVTRVAGNAIIVLGSDAPVSSWNTVREAGMANRD